MRPRLLDLCAGRGGAARGYIRAGWDVIGADVNDYAAEYPGEFVQMDALDALTQYAPHVDAIHTSPPCQRWTHGNTANNTDHHPNLIDAHRAALTQLGKPWVIENVPRAPLHNPLILCGTMFGLTTTDTDATTLHLRRHRHFETSHLIPPPGPCHHPPGVQWAGAYGGARRDKHQARNIRHGGYVPPVDVLRRLLDLDGMSEAGLFQAIPPAYTHHIGTWLLTHIEATDSRGVSPIRS